MTRPSIIRAGTLIQYHPLVDSESSLYYVHTILPHCMPACCPIHGAHCQGLLPIPSPLANSQFGASFLLLFSRTIAPAPLLLSRGCDCPIKTKRARGILHSCFARYACNRPFLSETRADLDISIQQTRSTSKTTKPHLRRITRATLTSASRILV